MSSFYFHITSVPCDMNAVFCVSNFLYDLSFNSLSRSSSKSLYLWKCLKLWGNCGTDRNGECLNDKVCPESITCRGDACSTVLGSEGGMSLPQMFGLLFWHF